MGMAMRGDRSGVGFLHWVKFYAETPTLRVSDVVRVSGGGTLGDKQAAAYDAPFPSDRYMAGARQFPSLVPMTIRRLPLTEPRGACWNSGGSRSHSVQ